LIFFTGSVIALFTFWSFHRMITKIQEKMAEGEEDERTDGKEGDRTAIAAPEAGAETAPETGNAPEDAAEGASREGRAGS